MMSLSAIHIISGERKEYILKQSDNRITALYARLSRDDEREGVSGSIQNQRAILEQYARDNHLTNPASSSMTATAA
jgi:predicted site-specific integrase-resolvase